VLRYSALHGLDPGRATAEAQTILHALLLHDELLQQRKTGAAFGGYSEACIDFYPTFKFDLGCNVCVHHDATYDVQVV
jgi:hypothetical protein